MCLDMHVAWANRESTSSNREGNQHKVESYLMELSYITFGNRVQYSCFNCFSWEWPLGKCNNHLKQRLVRDQGQLVSLGIKFEVIFCIMSSKYAWMMETNCTDAVDTASNFHYTIVHVGENVTWHFG